MRLALGLVLGIVMSAMNAQAAQPNLVVIIADDMSFPMLGAMPLTRSLIGLKGMTFQQSFVEDSLCAPSRSTFLIGEYAHNHGVHTNGPGAGGGWPALRSAGLEQDTVAVTLQANGYRTGLVGKYLNGYASSRVPPGWSTWIAAGENIDTGYNYWLNENGRIVNYGTGAANYGDDVLARKAVEFIKASSNKPLFLYFAPSAPHTPAKEAPRHTGLFQGTTAPRTPAFNEADVSDKPPFVAALPSLVGTQIADLDRRYAQALRSLQAVDESVAAIVQALADVGRLANTFLIFTNDNGFRYGEHRIAGKALGYEPDIHVPLLVRGPHVPAGRIDNEHLIVNADLAPTLLTLAGAPIPTNYDGRSFKAILLGNQPSTPWRQSFPLVRWNVPGAVDAYPEFRGARTVHHSWIEWADGSRELYDLVADPYQLQNLAGVAGLDDLRARLSALTAALATCAGVACRDAERQPVP